MSSLQNKIDFVALVSVTRANSNGDPLNGNQIFFRLLLCRLLLL